MSFDVQKVGMAKTNTAAGITLNEKTEALKEASKWLKLAVERAVSGDVTAEIGHVRENLEKAGKFPNDIGASEGKLLKLETDGYKNEALKWTRLAKERAGTGDVSFEVDQVRKFARKAGLSLSDADALKQIGTSEGELSGLVEKGNENEAFKWLHLARERSNTNKVSNEIEYFFEYVSKTDKPLAYFKTSIDDIALLDQKASDNASMPSFLRAFKQVPTLGFVVNALFH
jgi:hypothetical protein